MTNWFDKVEIWAFAGKMGSGKNHLAERIFPSLLMDRDIHVLGQKPSDPPLFLAFADHLKIHCLGMHPELTYQSVFGLKTTESRQILQKVGGGMRESIGIDVWVNILENWIRIHYERGVRRFILTDLRHQNELKWCQSIGAKTIYIRAKQRNLDRLKQETNGDPVLIAKLASHESEISLDGLEDQFTAVIDNDYDDKLKAISQLRALLSLK